MFYLYTGFIGYRRINQDGLLTAIHMLKIIIHRFIVRYILIAPLNTSQSDMPYFFETSHEHFVSSIGRKLSEIFDYSIKDDRHISESSKAVYECKIADSQNIAISSLCASCYWCGESLQIYMFTYCDYIRDTVIHHFGAMCST